MSRYPYSNESPQRSGERHKLERISSRINNNSLGSRSYNFTNNSSCECTLPGRYGAIVTMVCRKLSLDSSALQGRVATIICRLSDLISKALTSENWYFFPKKGDVLRLFPVLAANHCGKSGGKGSFATMVCRLSPYHFHIQRRWNRFWKSICFFTTFQ